MSHSALVKRIDAHLNRTGLSATRLGREAMGDPRIVFDLRAGRKPRLETERRLVAWLSAGQGEEEGRSCSRR
jgi:hypothetical protein